MIKHTFRTFIFLYFFIKYKKSIGKSGNTAAALKLERFIKKERGVFLKMCQYLGTNDKHHQIIKDLSFQKSEVLSREKIKRIIEESGVQFPETYTVGECIASASIGQVNAIDAESPKVIKLKFPGLDNQIKYQQSILKILPKKIIKKKTSIDINDYGRMIESLLKKECDFKNEANMHSHIFSLVTDNNHFRIPRIYKNQSCEHFIVSERLFPTTDDNIKIFSKRYSENLAFTYLHLLALGFTQGDSNHGNFLFLSDQKIGVIDFGQFYQFPNEFVGSLTSLIKKLRSEEDFDDFEYYKAMGFKPEILEMIRPHLRMLSMILFEPFIVNKSFNLQNWDYVLKINSILGQKKWLFRSAGGDEFFMIIKSFVGLKNLMIKVGANVNWYQIFDEIFHSSQLIEPIIEGHKAVSVNQARWVQVSIRDNQKIDKEFKVSLAEVFRLESFFPEKVKVQLDSKGISLNEICSEVLKSGSAPCELVSFEVDNKEYFISLI
jgi:predicted unusual protein kinase regulating ubiquinone biosynthesis (AarF/ABC1/UbiB family)